MKKLRTGLTATVAVLGIGGALATVPKQDCTTQPQFRKLGSNNYVSAGTLNVNYRCDASTTTCTYIHTGSGSTDADYTACRTQATYVPIH